MQDNSRSNQPNTGSQTNCYSKFTTKAGNIRESGDILIDFMGGLLVIKHYTCP